MKHPLIFFILIITTFQGLVNGQAYEYGTLQSSSGLCASLRNVGQPIVFSSCNSSDPNQSFSMNIGSVGPTFISGSRCIQVNDSLVVVVADCTGSIGNNNNIWSIKNTGDNLVTIKDNNNRKCLDLSANGLVTVKDCGENYSSQLFSIVSKSTDPMRLTYNVHGIPLVGNLFLDSINRQGSYGGLNYAMAGYNLTFNDCILKVLGPSNQVLWSSSSTPVDNCLASAQLIMQQDGNLCIYKHEDRSTTAWCSGTGGSTGRYFAMIPPYSYAREFGIVILDSNNQMIWGRFGKQVTLDAPYVLVPGNYLDFKNSNKNKLAPGQFITNGREYLIFGSDGVVRLNYGFNSPTTRWSSPAPTSSQYGPYVFGIYSDGNVCATNSAPGQDPMFCTMLRPNVARYVQVPLIDYNDVGRWGWVSQDGQNLLSWAYLRVPIVSSEIVQNPATLSTTVASQTMTFTIQADGKFLVQTLATGRNYYPATGLIQNGVYNGCELHRDVPWIHNGFWSNTNQFAIRNYVSTTCGVVQSNYLVFNPGQSGDKYLVAGTGFPTLFMLDANGIMTFQWSF